MTQLSRIRSTLAQAHTLQRSEFKWGRFHKFYALSAVYFGLASAVGAQPATGSPERSAEQSTDAPRQEHFQHPMLEQPSSHEMQLEKDKSRIQRRGNQDAIRDGGMQRNIYPGAADAQPPALDRSVRDQLDRKRQGTSN